MVKLFIFIFFISFSYPHDLGTANDFLNHYPFGKSKEDFTNKDFIGKVIMSLNYLD